MAVTPTFPGGILPWKNRIDKVNTIFANDPNTLASDLIAVENTLGTNPHIEAAPPVGSKITYKNVSARINDTLLGNQLPVAIAGTSGFNVRHYQSEPTHNTYNKIYDPWDYFNGQDFTIRANGWYVVTVEQTIPWSASGFFHIQLMSSPASGGVANGMLAPDHWTWDFAQNKEGVPGHWGKVGHTMHISWQGPLLKGQRISVFSNNATSRAVSRCRTSWLRLSYHRQIPASAAG